MSKITYVVGNDGQVRQIPIEQYTRAVESGDQAASAQQVEQFKIQQKAEADPVMAAAGGIVKGGVNALTAIPRAVTAGVNAVAPGMAPDLSGWTGDEALKAMDRHALKSAYAEHGMPLDQADEAKYMLQLDQERAARLGTTAGQVGNVVGQVAGSAPLMGLGAGAKAATGLGAEGAGLLSRIAGGAVEGAAMMGTQGVADASEQAHNEGRALTGEQAVASLMHGVVGGGLVGGAFAGAGGLLGKVLGRKGATTVEDTGEKLEPEALAEPRKPGMLARVMGMASGKNPETIDELTAFTPEARETRKLAVFEGDKTRETAERAIRGHGNQLEESLRNITPEWQGGKPANVAATVAREPEAMAQQASLAQDVMAGLREKIDAMGDKDVYQARGDVARMTRSLNVTEKKVAAGLEAGRPEDVFTAMDTMKRDLGPISRLLERSKSSAERETYTVARQSYEQLQQALEHPAWGGAADMQRDVNAAFAEWKPLRDLFKGRFLTKTGQEGWLDIHGMDPGKIGGYVRGLIDPAKDLDHSIIDRYLSSTEKLTSSLSKAGELTPAKAAELDAVKNAVAGFQQETGNAAKSLSAINKLDQLRGGGQHGIGVGALVGSAFGGHLGGALGGILGAVSNPAAMVERMAVAERLAGRTASTMSGAMDGLFGSVGNLAEKAAPIGQAARFSALELFQGSHETPEHAYRHRLQELVEAPTNLPERVANAIGAQGVQDPALALAAFTSASRAIEYLKQHLPEGQYDMTSLTPQSTKVAPPLAAINEFADRWSAVMRPRDVLAGIPNGTVSPTQMEAIGAVYPSMFGDLRAQAMRRVEEADTAGHEIPLRTRTILDQLFDLQGSAGPTYTTEFAAKYGPMMGDGAQKKQNKPNPGAKPALGQRLQTLSQTMMGT